MERKKLIEFRNIVKSFDGQIVLKGVNLDIYEKEFVTLLGPSGCGKTTLLRILGGFLEQDEGSVIFDGVTIEAGACISGALICSGAHIGRGVGISDGSVVGENCHIPDKDVLSPGSMTLSGTHPEAIAASSVTGEV